MIWRLDLTSLIVSGKLKYPKFEEEKMRDKFTTLMVWLFLILLAISGIFALVGWANVLHAQAEGDLISVDQLLWPVNFGMAMTGIMILVFVSFGSAPSRRRMIASVIIFIFFLFSLLYMNDGDNFPKALARIFAETVPVFQFAILIWALRSSPKTRNRYTLDSCLR